MRGRACSLVSREHAKPMLISREGRRKFREEVQRKRPARLLVGEQGARKADVDGRLLLVAGQHPDFDARARQLLDGVAHRLFYSSNGSRCVKESFRGRPHACPRFCKHAKWEGGPGARGERGGARLLQLVLDGRGAQENEVLLDQLRALLLRSAPQKWIQSLRPIDRNTRSLTRKVGAPPLSSERCRHPSSTPPPPPPPSSRTISASRFSSEVRAFWYLACAERSSACLCVRVEGVENGLL